MHAHTRTCDNKNCVACLSLSASMLAKCCKRRFPDIVYRCVMKFAQAEFSVVFRQATTPIENKRTVLKQRRARHFSRQDPFTLTLLEKVTGLEFSSEGEEKLLRCPWPNYFWVCNDQRFHAKLLPVWARNLVENTDE